MDACNLSLSKLVALDPSILVHRTSTSNNNHPTSKHQKAIFYIWIIWYNWSCIIIFKVTKFILRSFKSYVCRYLNVRRKIAERRKVALNFDAENANFIKDDRSSLKNQLSKYFKIKPECFKGRSNSISLYQTCIMMMTITAISAVDFKIFPRRFRKSKTFGISLVNIK